MGVAKIERSRKGKAAAAISAAPRENEPTKEEVRAAWSKIRRAAALGLSVFLSSVLYNVLLYRLMPLLSAMMNSTE